MTYLLSFCFGRSLPHGCHMFWSTLNFLHVPVGPCACFRRSFVWAGLLFLPVIVFVLPHVVSSLRLPLCLLRAYLQSMSLLRAVFCWNCVPQCVPCKGGCSAGVLLGRGLLRLAISQACCMHLDGFRICAFGSQSCPASHGFLAHCFAARFSSGLVR